jgi:hypothetical protein
MPISVIQHSLHFRVSENHYKSVLFASALTNPLHLLKMYWPRVVAKQVP